MKANSELYDEHLGRLKKVIGLEKPDRIPIMINADAFLLKYAEPSASISDYFERPDWAHEKEIEGLLKLGDIDCVMGCGVPKSMIGAFWLSSMKIPGRDLPKDELWQVVEPGTMTEEDYDIIINKGWNHFYLDFLVRRLEFDPTEMEKGMIFFKNTTQRLAERGVVTLIGGMGGAPFDALSAARSLPKFMRDLCRIPEKVKAALEVAREELTDMMISEIRTSKPLTVAVQPAVRSSMMSPKMFEEFAWPLFKGLADASLDEGANVVFHMDGEWEHLLSFFRDFPKGRCIFDPDGSTDIYKIKEVLGDRMCITGDVSPVLSFLGKPDEVYDYCKKQIDEIGPSGFMVAASCAIPPNAKPENVEAMVASALDS